MMAWPRAPMCRASLSALVALTIPACGPDDPTVPSQAATAPTSTTSAVPTQAPPAAEATPGIDRVERVTAPPTPAPSPSVTIQPRKDFVDPPLPAELKDDGGLKPLPPTPAAQR